MRSVWIDWSFWGFICGALTLVISVALSIYIYRDQSSYAYAEFASQTRLLAAGKPIDDAVALLEGMYLAEKHPGRREILAGIYRYFYEKKKAADEEKAKAAIAESKLKALAEASERQKKRAAEDLASARAAQEAAAAEVIASARRAREAQEALQHIEERRQEKWLK